MHPTEIEILNVTMKNARGGTTLTHLLVLASIRRAEVTDLRIMNNRRGALALFDSSVALRGHVTLSNNSAINGGGIALYGNSLISLEYRFRLDIINNTADQLGGGVFVDRRYGYWWLTRENFCFIWRLHEQTSIYFEGNEAGYTGSDLYGGMLDQCTYRNCVSELGLLTNLSGCRQTEVSSDARGLTFCQDQCIHSTTTEKTLRVYP